MHDLRFLSLIALATASVLTLGACSNRSGDPHPDKLMTKRVAIFKKFTQTLEPMGLVARDRRDYVKAEFVEQALALKALSTQPWVYFSADGNYAPSRAKPEIWLQPEAFAESKTRYLAAVDNLVKVADSADMTAIKAAVDGVQKSCKSCHDRFRSETARSQ